MSKPGIFLRTQTPDDAQALLALHEGAFGPGRFTRTAYRLRENGQCEPRLNLCAEFGGRIAGAVQFTPIIVGGEAGALLLGPLVIDEAHKNQGFGLALMNEGLRRAQALGYRLVLLVGDEPYYARAGFARTPEGRFEMPGPVDPARLLYKELQPGALARYRGLMQRLPKPPAPCRGQKSARDETST